MLIDAMRCPNLTRYLLLVSILSTITVTVLTYWSANQKAARGTPANAALLKAAVQPVAATFTVNTATDLPDTSIGDGHCDTDGNPGNGDQCTLRAAIQEANASASADVINFN